MSRSRHDWPEHVPYRLAQACVLMLGVACSTTLDPTFEGSVALSAGGNGSGGANRVAGGGTAAGGESESPPLAPAIMPRALTDCAVSMLGEHQYLACSTPRTFAEASADCVQAGATLIRVDGGEETAWLKGLSFPGHAWGWLGASRNATFDWTWLDGTRLWHGDAGGMAEPGAYTNWHDGEPDNTSDTVRMAEACATFDVGNGTWFDRYCELLLPYVCELTSAAGGK